MALSSMNAKMAMRVALCNSVGMYIGAKRELYVSLQKLYQPCLHSNVSLSAKGYLSTCQICWLARREN